MAKKTTKTDQAGGSKRKMKTSIGSSKNSRPTNKHKKRNWKKYNKQGK